MNYGSASRRCCRSTGRGSGDRSHSTTEDACRASCSCSTPGSTGSICRPNLGSAPARPAGDASAARVRPEYGTRFIGRSSPTCTPSVRSTGPQSVSTAATSGLRRGRGNRPLTGRPRPSRLEAPHRLRFDRNPARDPHYQRKHPRYQSRPGSG
jgi:hypothetical protein